MMKGFLKRIAAVILAMPIMMVWILLTLTDMCLMLIVWSVSWFFFGSKRDDKLGKVFDWFGPVFEHSPEDLWNWWLGDDK